MFTAIAPTYDRLNRILSLRLDRRWRRQAVARLGWERKPEGIYLDLCAGTLDFAATLAGRPGFRGRIVGADFVRRMLELGPGQVAAAGPGQRRCAANCRFPTRHSMVRWSAGECAIWRISTPGWPRRRGSSSPARGW